MSLLSRLILIFLSILVPGVGIGIFTDYEARNSAEAAVREEASRLLDRVQGEQARVFDGIRQIAALVAATDAVRAGDRAGCQALLDRTVQRLSPHLTISVADRRGVLLCSSRPEQVGRSIGDRSDIMAALKTDEMVVGEFIRPDMAAGGGALPFALRYGGDTGDSGGVVTVLLDVAWWNAVPDEVPLPDGVSLIVTDRAGTILAVRSAHAAAPSSDAPEVMATVRPSAAVRGLFVGIGIGIDPEEIRQRLDEVMRHRTLVIGAGLLAALAAAAALAYRLVLHPVAALARTADLWRAGDARAGAFASDDTSEFGTLGRTFDAMADALERSRQERERAEAAADRMAAVLEGTADGICEVDGGWLITYANLQCRTLLGGDRELVGMPLLEALPEALADTFRTECARALADQVPVSFEAYPAPLSRWLSVRLLPCRDGLLISFQDITERRETELCIERAEAHYRAIVDTAVDGMVVIDHTGIIQSFNPAAERMFGHAAAEVIGRNVTVLMQDRDAAVHDGHIWNYRHGSDRNVIGRKRDLEGRRKDGTVFALELSVAEWSDGRQRFFTGFMRDITLRRRTDAAIQAARDEAVAARAEAERAVLAKSKFLAAASHDLRQPVQSLFFLGSALADGLRGHPMLPLVGSINQATEALKLLLDGLLDISKLDAGVITPQVTDMPVADLLRRLGAEYAHRAERQGLRLKVVPSDSTVRTDAVLLERILRNLIENALRYTERGRILIGCRRIDLDTLRIEVRDTGIGFPADQAESIFEEFHRINPGDGGDAAEEAQGLGLGLAIVRRLAGLLGHPVSVTSTPGRGSRFSIDVPLVASAAAALAAPPVIDDRRGRGLALILDDEPVILIGLKLLLESWGYRVLSARNPGDALRQVADDGVPDLIVADYRLGDGVKGPDAIRKLRAATGADIPGIILTGDTTQELLDEVERGGFDLLHKPVASHELRRKLEALCEPEGGP